MKQSEPTNVAPSLASIPTNYCYDNDSNKKQEKKMVAIDTNIFNSKGRDCKTSRNTANIINGCQALKRLFNALKWYHKFNDLLQTKIYRPILIDFVVNIYPNLFDDYQHLMDKHCWIYNADSYHDHLGEIRKELIFKHGFKHCNDRDCLLINKYYQKNGNETTDTEYSFYCNKFDSLHTIFVHGFKINYGIVQQQQNEEIDIDPNILIQNILKHKETECKTSRNTENVLSGCDSLKRLANALKWYHQSHSSHTVISKQDLIQFYVDVYPNLLRDYEHLVQEHSIRDRDQTDLIKQELINEYGFKECDDKRCRLLNNEDKDNKTNDIEYSFYCKQFDSLHSHIFHDADDREDNNKSNIHIDDSQHQNEKGILCIFFNKLNQNIA